ncbi:MAG TPA: glutamate 5-kinase [Armatimonadaceae bacterium]|nr:glutamate 5-kinase [Armatimonadaceae bacterium]
MKRVVVKIGTSTLTDPRTGGPDRVFLNSLAAQIAQERERGRQVVLVTSGAIRAGMARLGLEERPRTIPGKQAAASVGQGVLMSLYGDIFANYGIAVGQVLLTRDDLHVRSRYVNARNTFEALFANGALPIVNENDTVAVDEIKVGDNDTLAALVTLLIDGDALLLLSDVNGLYNADPAEFPDARLLARVEKLDDAVMAMAGGAGTPGGTGGMRTKLNAARIATGSGACLWIANGRRPHVLADCIAGTEGCGTFFAPSTRRVPARKRWLAWGAGEPRGTLVVNVCARRVLEEEGRSLLPVGVVGVEGEFAEGDLVAVREETTGEVFARGLSRYGASEARRIAGCPTPRLPELLGREPVPYPELIHRDQLALLF